MRYSQVLLLLVFLAGATSSVAQKSPGPKSAGARTVRAVPGKPKPGSVAPKRKRLILPAHEMKFSRVRAFDDLSARERDSLLACPRLFWVSTGSLLFRRLPTDTVFFRIELEPPPYPFNEDYFVSGYMCLLHQDLNHDGIPEALVGFWRGWDHGHGSRVALNLIDVSSTPRLLLSAVTEIKEEGWTSDPDNPDSGDKIFFTSGWGRSVKLGGDDIRTWLEGGSSYGLVVEVKPLTATPYLRIGRLSSWSVLNGNPYKHGITPLTPGRYQYRDGHLVWVGQ